MSIDRLRIRLMLAYMGIFALILLFLGGIAVFGFSRELVYLQDELLTQEARNQARNLLTEEHRETLAEGSDEFSWIALNPEGRVSDQDPVAPSLGLPSPDLARQALQEGGIASGTIQGPNGSSRAVSMPVRESGEVVGVIQYARSLQQVRNTVVELVLVLLPLGIGALGLATIGGAYMAGRAVRPLRDSFERQRTFIADASHELKTPLTLIRSSTEVLQRGLESPDSRELADDVLTEADRMSGMISNLLLIARLDSGKLSVEEKDFDLTAVIVEASDRFERRADEESVHLEVRVPDNFSVHGDPAYTSQILAVLFDNAISHTPCGGSVTVTARTQGGFVETAIEDTGAGIPVAHLPHIFERFYRVDTARSREKGGTGLGLSIARDLARAQNGDLTAENAEDRGAVFYIKLPKA